MFVGDKYLGYIYVIVNLVNDKCYVGQTRQSPRKRWWQHTETAREGLVKGLLYYAMRKYGVDNFKMYVVEEVYASDDDELTESLNQREKYWIEYLDTFGDGGYNMTEGGNDAPTYKANVVINVDSTGDVIGIYESAASAAFIHHISRSAIQAACISPYHFSNGSFWYYQRDLYDDIEIGDNIGEQHAYKCGFKKGNTYGSKKVAEYTKDGMLVRVYMSMREAGQNSGVSECTVRRCIKNECPTTKGKVFKLYKEEDINGKSVFCCSH